MLKKIFTDEFAGFMEHVRVDVEAEAEAEVEVEIEVSGTLDEQSHQSSSITVFACYLLASHRVHLFGLSLK